MGDRILGRGEETGPVAAADRGGIPTEGYTKRYFVRRTREEAWREGGSEGSGQRRVMEGDGAAASKMGDAQVGGGPGGETNRDWCDGKEMGDAQVGV